MQKALGYLRFDWDKLLQAEKFGRGAFMAQGSQVMVLSFVSLVSWHVAYAEAPRSAGLGASQAQTDHPLSREDNSRSVFAGSKLERIQAFDRQDFAQSGPAADDGARVGTRSKVQPSRQAARPSEAVQRAQPEEKVAPAGSYSWQRGTQLPAQVYKNIPLNTVYLNGENIVGLRNQVLEGVNIRFDSKGNIFIDAPHYEVHHDSSFHPLLPEETPQFAKDVDNTIGAKGTIDSGTSNK